MDSIDAGVNHSIVVAAKYVELVPLLKVVVSCSGCRSLGLELLAGRRGVEVDGWVDLAKGFDSVDAAKRRRPAPNTEQRSKQAHATINNETTNNTHHRCNKYFYALDDVILWR